MDLIREISRQSPTKLVLVVMDGLGGLPDPETGQTELETANTPNLDKLAAKGVCGLTNPVAPGITPGSSPGHLALFGYNPLTCHIGRGVLEAIGIDIDLRPGDVAARGNFCTVDESGVITDRRAGRISTDMSAELCRLLDGIVIEHTQVIVRPVKEHRLVVIFRGDNLDPNISDSDPQQADMAPWTAAALKPEAERTASIATQFIAQAKATLSNRHPANMVLLRGFSMHPNLPTMSDIYKLKAAAIASYPMYRGLAKLIGMEVLDTGITIDDEFATLARNYSSYDFFFIHIKATDAAGEDGDFKRKVAAIEETDKALASLISLEPDVIVVTADHSTPAVLEGHSWHPVPVLLYSRWCRPDKVEEFSEAACLGGGLGQIPATQVMPLAMANALKLTKYGA